MGGKREKGVKKSSQGAIYLSGLKELKKRHITTQRGKKDPRNPGVLTKEM